MLTKYYHNTEIFLGLLKINYYSECVVPLIRCHNEKVCILQFDQLHDVFH